MPSRILPPCFALAFLVTHAALAQGRAELSSPAEDHAASGETEDGSVMSRRPTLEIAVASVGLNAAWRLTGPLHFGVGGGVGPTFYRLSQIEGRDAGVDPVLEVVFINAFLLLSPADFFDLDVGGRVAVGGALSQVEGAPRGALLYGAYADFRLGSRKVKLGPRFEYLAYRYGEFTEYGWRVTPILLRLAI